MPVPYEIGGLPTMTMLVLIAGILLAAIVQSATGFGYALVAGPIVYAVLDPAEAVALILIVGEVVSVLILFGERRRPRVLWRETTPALAAALPGLPLGALLVRVVPASAMTLAVGAVVSALCSLRLARLATRGTSVPAGRIPGPGTAVAAGFAVGVLTTSTTTAGPPLAIWLTARRLEPAVIRDVVTVIFAILDLLGLGILLAVAGIHVLPAPGTLAPLAVAAAAGHLLGRRIFLRLPARAYEPTVLAVALVAGLAAVMTSVLESL